MKARLTPWLALAAGCSLTPFPDVTSQWSEPCEESRRLCDVEFKLHAGAETKVELRGDFKAGAWVTGVPMQRATDSWVATVPVQWGTDVQYKFFVDGTTWRLDPANPKTGTLGGGNTNSLLQDVTCPSWTCVAR